MADDGVVITEKELETLKYEVLTENIDEISSQLGDPGRYFATFKAKNLLDQSDCESIKGQVTSIEKAMHFVELISKRTGRNGEHSYDVFVGVLKRMRIHIHIVRILNQALAKKRAELKVKKSKFHFSFRYKLLLITYLLLTVRDCTIFDIVVVTVLRIILKL